MTFLPIVDRELSVAARRGATYWLRFWTALVVLALWIFLLTKSNAGSPGQMGHILFNALGIVALGFSLFAGAFLTADCLSEEKREGTLGLLFLTDLKSYDVVLGKLAASSLNAFFGLLATFPILGLTLLLGGVTGKEFARMMLTLAVTLFFSLGTGLFVSAVSRETRQTMGRAFLLVLTFGGLFPVAWWLISLARGYPAPDWLLWPSPVYAYRQALDAYYRSWTGPHEFWMSLATVFGTGLAGVALAVALLPRAWRRQEAGTAGQKKRFPRLGFRAATTFRQRAEWLELNPFYWLAARDGAGGRLAVRVLLALGPVWLIFLAGSFYYTKVPPWPFIIGMFFAYGLHQTVKLMMVTEASRRMNEDRRSGALELLLATPLRVEDILSGQVWALRRGFATPMIILCAMNLALCATVVLDGGPLQIRGDDVAIFMELFVGGLLVLLTDSFALGWVGMWRGLKAAKHHRAVAGSMGRIMGPPWLVVFLFIFIQPRMNGAGDVEFMFGMWFVLGMVVSGVSGAMARARLYTEFRQLAGQRYQGKAA